ncbi:putative protein tyrosine phosphatase [Cavenderia fasciculata]|uniref:Uncharacterized protein n=1 Tax=Cavenderia fasciculata TaxID=261658 RepID=F4PVA1_CACFS|nr:putative protein tyrosine phosphatase [Cavenderia fasciculata]EGG20464.1 putative protein tyrosine phosphatase [Cavenderia fasciculata]|eukprot:XP_004358234.1 putative protein tyrosine phosphatase [Cavenderia fasciculata]
MSFLEEIKSKKRLNQVNTIVTRVDGSKVIISSEGEEIVYTDDSLTNYGYIVDTKPDELAHQIDLSSLTDLNSITDLSPLFKLYIGSQDAAHNKNELTKKSITHILNVGYGIDNIFQKDITYLSINILDNVDVDITKEFPRAFQFIEQSFDNGATALLVHCNAGISRSSTILVGFLMNKFKIPMQRALDVVKEARPSIKPNFGFIKSLLEYEKEILFTVFKLWVCC